MSNPKLLDLAQEVEHIASFLGPFAVPDRVKAFAPEVSRLLAKHKVQGAKVKPFNSGYVGLVIDAGPYGKWLYVDQPGVRDRELAL